MSYQGYYLHPQYQIVQAPLQSNTSVQYYQHTVNQPHYPAAPPHPHHVTAPHVSIPASYATGPYVTAYPPAPQYVPASQYVSAPQNPPPPQYGPSVYTYPAQAGVNHVHNTPAASSRYRVPPQISTSSPIPGNTPRRSGSVQPMQTNNSEGSGKPRLKFPAILCGSRSSPTPNKPSEAVVPRVSQGYQPSRESDRVIDHHQGTQEKPERCLVYEYSVKKSHKYYGNKRSSSNLQIPARYPSF